MLPGILIIVMVGMNCDSIESVAMNVKEAIRESAYAAGFDDVGFAEGGRLPDDEVRLRRWIEDGRHGGMSWIARDTARRSTTSEWVRTVVALAKAYPPLIFADGERRHASYADGHDYHRTLKAMMTGVAAAIRSFGGRAKRFVDTGAILERAWARSAGLGFIGKSTMLLSRSHGPHVYLGVIFTDLLLEPDRSAVGDCGDCVKCIEACPTSALDERGLDARKCISYLTIELKRPMTPVERSATGEWDFGCDVCIDVCPYASYALPAIAPHGRGVTRFGK